MIPYQLPTELEAWWNKYHKPVLVSEYGADTVPGLHHDPPFMVHYASSPLLSAISRKVTQSVCMPSVYGGLSGWIHEGVPQGV